MARTTLVLSCEHAGNRIPREYTELFAGAEATLESHRGWDPGALRLARLLARRLDRPLLATDWSRLLVESNRSPSNPRIWSRYTKALPRDERERILEHYWWPHRHSVDEAVATGVKRNGRVVHIATHTFAPVLDGEVRNADVCLLYDSTRRREVALARRWGTLLQQHLRGLRVRYNYPYRGCTDGLTTWLRRRYPATRYAGLELEVNQAVAGSPEWRRVGEAVAHSLSAAMGEAGRAAR